MEDGDDKHALFGCNVEPVEMIDALSFALEALRHNISLVTYMHDHVQRNEHGRVDELAVFGEIGGKDEASKRAKSSH